MARLEDVSVESLEAALEEATGKRETQRLIVAIIYKRGPSVPMIAEWLDLREATVYRWFDRLETEPVDRAVRDRQRPGRPSKLDDAQRARFQQVLDGSPAAVGYEATEWTPDLARRFLGEEFDVEYSRRHVQRLLNDLGSS